jgi:glycosyltransferase involved in cell wall biosynthesis
MSKNKVIGVIDENPYDPRTWSGSGRYFFEALKNQGVLYGAISAQPPKPTQWLYKALSFQPELRKWKFKYHLNVDYYRQMTRAARQALSKFDAGQYQVILQVGAWMDMTGYRGKQVASYHDGNLATLLSSPYGYPNISKTYIRRTLAYERDLYNRVDLIFSMSKWLANSFCRDFGVAPGKVFPVGAGINLPRVRDIHEKSYDAPRILFVGKDFKRKGGENLLKAFNMVRKEIKEAELTIIGPKIESPPEGVRCKGFISKMSRNGLDKLLDEYQRASVFVIPSLYEPFGISFVEAMAHRLPCIGTNICAMPEIIQHGKTGYVVPPWDPNMLAKNLLKLLHEPERCREFGDAGYQHYIQNFTWLAVAARMCKIIEKKL